MADPSPPGWYPDPFEPGGWRWHDGSTWTSWTGPPQGPPRPPAFAYAAVDPRADIESERRILGWTRAAIVAMGFGAAFTMVTTAVIFGDFFEALGDVIRNDDLTERDVERLFEDAQPDPVLSLVSNVVSIVPTLALVMLAVWTNRVAHVARRLGYPARRSTTWAAAGWFVPIVNFWFPYQSLVDSLAPCHPRRALVLRWWLLYLVGPLLLLPTFVAFLVGAAGVAVVLALVACGAGLLAAVLGVQVVDAIADDHREALERRMAGG